MTVAPQVSVVLPVHNGAAYLSESLDSIHAQSFVDLEILVIDDGSDDASPDIVRRHAEKDPRIVLLTQPQRGVPASLNHGLAKARGALIARMDADDIAEPDRLERQVAYLAAHPTVAVVGSAVTLIDRDGTPLGLRRHPGDHARIVDLLRDGENAIAHPTVLMRRDAVLAVGGYRDCYRHSEDFDLWLRLAARAKLANLAEPLLRYRVHPANISARYRAEQVLASATAVMAARRRGAGYADPTDELDRLTPADIARLPFDEGERTLMAVGIVTCLLEQGDAVPLPEMVAIAAMLAPAAPLGTSAEIVHAMMRAAGGPIARDKAERIAGLAMQAIRDGGVARLGLLLASARLHPQGLAGIMRLAARRILRVSGRSRRSSQSPIR